MGSEEEKSRRKLRRRNFVAKKMLVDQRKQFSEKTFEDKTKKKSAFNKHKALKNYAQGEYPEDE